VLGSADVPPSHADSDSSLGRAQLLALVSHELRTPASVVGGYLRMLLRETDPALGERQHRMVEEAEKSCGRIVALLGELSEIARLDAGTATVNERSFDLFPMLDELAVGVHEVEDREVLLGTRGEAAGAVITGDLAGIRASFAAFFRAVMREQPASCRVAVDRRRVQNGSDWSAVVVVAHEDDIERAYTSAPAPFNEHRGGLGSCCRLHAASSSATADASGRRKGRGGLAHRCRRRCFRSPAPSSSRSAFRSKAVEKTLCRNR
jgi:hypothetical protein